MRSCALVMWAAARAGMALRLYRMPTLTPAVKQVLRRMGPGVMGAGVTQINLAVDVIIASMLPAGAVSYLYYADRVGQLPLGVIGRRWERRCCRRWRGRCGCGSRWRRIGR